ncbi:M14 family metallocarboxypeptidase [Camelliibacillus cellulosilyticus]|uniref:M14 family metallocarboxypeptidase n=1 Tax=Camelliibacillus cellulosilyticus TaxID=2174486 RepID=A0ABV9GI70_9BACL
MTARSGDTLDYFSRLFEVPYPLVIDSNPHIPDQRLKDGDTVAIPGYVVQPLTLKSHQTFWSVLTERQLPLDALRVVNPGVPFRKLLSASIIYVPVRVNRIIVKGKQTYDYLTLMRDIHRLKALYPFMTSRSIGRSVLGKNLTELAVGRGARRVHLNASFHAREWITTPIVMTFLNEYLLSLTNGRAIRGIRLPSFYDQQNLSIVPMVNPDGVDLAIHGASKAGVFEASVREINQGERDFSLWKANIRGVDLNKQFPADWDAEAANAPKQPAPSHFPGHEPLSEPEARAMASLVQTRDFARLLMLHTQGKEIYWRFKGEEPPISKEIAMEMTRVSGYQAVENHGSSAGLKDWFIETRRRPAFTIEAGKGDHPLPISDFDEMYQEMLGIFLAYLYT